MQIRSEQNDHVNKRILYSAIATETILYFGTMSYLRYVWYSDVERVPFHYYNDNAGYLQIDKFGHALGAYLESVICYKWLRKAGVKKNKALLYGATMGIVLQAPIEVFDGIYEGWGFSWGDILANSAGSAILIGQELLFDEQRVNFKFSFTRSEYASQSHGMLGDTYLQSLFYDYNGHSYWFSTGLREITTISSLPLWLDISLGYSANGMFGEFENRRTWKGKLLPTTIRERQFLLSFDIDWTSIKTDRYFLAQLFQALNFIKVPLPTLEYNSSGKFKFHILYF